jgi:hypothetical protein
MAVCSTRIPSAPCKACYEPGLDAASLMYTRSSFLLLSTNLDISQVLKKMLPTMIDKMVPIFFFIVLLVIISCLAFDDRCHSLRIPLAALSFPSSLSLSFLPPESKNSSPPFTPPTTGSFSSSRTTPSTASCRRRSSRRLRTSRSSFRRCTSDSASS